MTQFVAGYVTNKIPGGWLVVMKNLKVISLTSLSGTSSLVLIAVSSFAYITAAVVGAQIVSIQFPGVAFSQEVFAQEAPDPKLADWKTEEALKKSIDLNLNIASYNPQAAVENMCGLAVLYVKHQRIIELSTLLDRAIPLSVEVFGEANPRTQKLREFKIITQTAPQSETRWNSYMTRGLRAMKSGNYEQATSSYEGALQIIEKSAPGSKAMGVTLSVLGTAYLKDGQYKRAERTLKKALPIYQEFFVNDPDQIDTLKAGIAAARDGQGSSAFKESEVIGPSITDDGINTETGANSTTKSTNNDSASKPGNSDATAKPSSNDAPAKNFDSVKK